MFEKQGRLIPHLVDWDEVVSYGGESRVVSHSNVETFTLSKFVLVMQMH